MKKRFVVSLMLIIPCLVKADQPDFLREDISVSFYDQNKRDQDFQYELEKELFTYERTSLLCKKIRNASLLYTAVPVSLGLIAWMFEMGGFLPRDAAKVVFAIFASPLGMTIPVGLAAALTKWLSDEQIEQYQQKLQEHRYKMALLGQSFSAEQIEQYEQKLLELGLSR